VTFAQALDTWENAETISRGVMVVALGPTVRLKRDSEDAFTIRHKDCDIILIHRDGRYTINFGNDKSCEFYRRDLIAKYVFNEGV
jgi:hypothetical protein